VVIETWFVLEKSQNLSLVLLCLILSRQAKPKLTVAVGKPVLRNTVEERVFLVEFLFLGQQLLVTHIT